MDGSDPTVAWKAAQSLSSLPGQLPRALQQGTGPRGRDDQDHGAYGGRPLDARLKRDVGGAVIQAGEGWSCLDLQGSKPG